MSSVAVYLSKANGAEVKPAPSLDSIPVKDDEVLVKNNAVASNPKDWKLSKWGMFEGVEGNDISGVVEKVGKDVKEFKVGDRVRGENNHPPSRSNSLTLFTSRRSAHSPTWPGQTNTEHTSHTQSPPLRSLSTFPRICRMRKQRRSRSLD